VLFFGLICTFHTYFSLACPKEKYQKKVQGGKNRITLFSVTTHLLRGGSAASLSSSALRRFLVGLLFVGGLGVWYFSGVLHHINLLPSHSHQHNEHISSQFEHHRGINQLHNSCCT
jgi:hypothetical protein